CDTGLRDGPWLGERHGEERRALCGRRRLGHAGLALPPTRQQRHARDLEIGCRKVSRAHGTHAESSGAGNARDLSSGILHRPFATVRLHPLDPKDKITLRDSDAKPPKHAPAGDELTAEIGKQTKRIADLQRVLYADARHALLIVLQ